MGPSGIATLRRPARILGLTTLGALLTIVLIAVPAQAGPPSHPFLASLDGVDTPAGDFDHACGTATDSEGDLYVASAGNGAIDVFDADRAYLTTIANANEPCGLAVDSTGKLYVSESATGKVVRYTPNAYPFTGAPAYGAPIMVDGSGDAKGIAVDPADDFLYVAKGDRVDAYNPRGTIGIDEAQRIRVDINSGTFTLTFEGQTTAPIAFDATHAQLQAALEALSTIGPGNVSVSQGPDLFPTDHRITFIGALGHTDVEQLSSTPAAGIIRQTVMEAFDGHIGQGQLTDATGVAAYTYAAGRSGFEYRGGENRYVFAAEDATDEVKVFTGTNVRALTQTQVIDGSGAGQPDETPDGSFGFGPAGAYLAADPANGHLFVYDHTHTVLDEFEASGQYLTQVDHPAFADAQPTAIAVDRSGGATEGTLYVTAGASASAKVLAFDPLTPPSRSQNADLSFNPPNACGTVVDDQGNFYVARLSSITVYDPDGTPLTSLSSTENLCELAVDSQGSLYVRAHAPKQNPKILRYTPSSYPPTATTTYSAPVTIAETGDLPGSSEVHGVAVDPANDHVLITRIDRVSVYDSAANGNTLLDGDFGKAALKGMRIFGVDVCAQTGNVYLAGGHQPSRVAVLNPTGTTTLATIDGRGSPYVDFEAGRLDSSNIAVDQSNCHFLVSLRGPPFSGTVPGTPLMEFEASGAFLTAFGDSSEDVAYDNSGGPNDGRVFAVGGFHGVAVFDPLDYGERAVAVTGFATNFTAGSVTLNGTLDPRGFDLSDCHFEYVTDSQFQLDGFDSATSEPCVETPAGIGGGSDPAPVHADLSGLATGVRYRFRLSAENQFGVSQGDPGVFGPPIHAPKSATGIHFTEALLNASLDSSGLPTTYSFEYGNQGPCDASPCSQTPELVLPAGFSPSDVQASVFALSEGATYHFRLIASNDAGTVTGPDQTLTTSLRSPAQACPNAAIRQQTGSSHLPDCRAYELVTPADTRGDQPRAPTFGHIFDYWPVTPSGQDAGDRLVFVTTKVLTGTEGNGAEGGNGYEAFRRVGGWETRLFSPSAAEAPVRGLSFLGISPDHEYSFWRIGHRSDIPGQLPDGMNLRTPTGFELVGQGSSGIDPDAEGMFISPGGGHVVFTSRAHLEENAPPVGTEAIYDRTPDGSTHSVSLLPGELTPAAGAVYQGSSADGTAVAFKIDETLYLRHDNTETFEVADGPSSFAGISADGERIFYTDQGGGSTAVPPANLFVLEADSQTTTQIAPSSIFVNVSADGSHVYFSSTEQLDDADEGIPGAHNLYLWDGSTIRFIAVLDARDLGLGGTPADDTNLSRWAEARTRGVANAGAGLGAANDPSRTTADGAFLVFESHADLTGYDSAGHAEIYRYWTGDGSLICVSCDPDADTPTGDAALQAGSGVDKTTYIPGITDDGQAVFFESDHDLLTEDTNGVGDVYQWSAAGTPGCERANGCQALISSGRDEEPSSLYGMTPDGSDVFLSTPERLLATDIVGSHSIYDARVLGGFPAEESTSPCVEDCQGSVGAPPGLPAASSATLAGSGNLPPKRTKSRKCRSGRRQVRRAGKSRCVKRKGRQGKAARNERRAAR